jgi:hypothetical protein
MHKHMKMLHDREQEEREHRLEQVKGNEKRREIRR